MPKIRIYPDSNYLQGDYSSYWESDCVGDQGEGCVCWQCEQEHGDCFLDTEEDKQ